MEIEELQSAWVQMSQELDHQKKLTNEIILDMTKQKYQNKFNILTKYETVGAFVCFIVAFFVLLNFGKLDTWYLKICGILTLSFLIVLPVLVLSTLKKIKNIDITKGSYKENLKVYLRTKNRLLKLQQVGMAIGFVGLLFIVPVTSKIISNKNVFLTNLKVEQYVIFATTLVALAFFCKWAYKGYLKITQSAQDLIKDLE
ncbi:hypothetical protein [Maribacter stanieri]|uniref:Uncharacterized protein n=1 Tax=Maribacter stanieri TaxID=440514 RepID=A0A1I6K3Z1_9FLAO|nr:hypothetical protein [Maribacter stanieri]SFR85961.1 hypothetical protein SAMN04488010_3455 [Maribacter stanieri]|tara:strand:+ start:687 stop:1286 length:600 start_codon:yes stop_codon:yes gene_type:complete